MKPVTQLDDYGCGVACVSFITQKEYSNVVKVLGKKRAQTKGFYCKDLVAALKHFKFDYTRKYLKQPLRTKLYQEGTIALIKKSKRYPAGHYLVRHNRQWMDPWINLLFDHEIAHAKSGFRKRLPGKPIYVIFRTEE